MCLCLLSPGTKTRISFCLFDCHRQVNCVPFTVANIQSKDAPGVPESLAAVLRYTPFKTDEELFAQFDKIPDPTGTRIIIFNLRKEKVGESQTEQLEFVVDEDTHDILIRPDVFKGKEVRFQRNRGSDGIDIPLDYSLRVRAIPSTPLNVPLVFVFIGVLFLSIFKTEVRQ